MPAVRFVLFSAALVAGLYGLFSGHPLVAAAVDVPPSRCSNQLNERLARHDYGPEAQRLAAQLQRELSANGHLFDCR